MSDVATIEQEIQEIRRDEMESFVMPKPSRGQPVMWYPQGNRGSGEIAFAIEVGRRNVVIQLASGVCYSAVYHIDDPKLRLIQQIRENGGWDFTEETKESRANKDRVTALTDTVDQLQARLAALEELVGGTSKKNK